MALARCSSCLSTAPLSDELLAAKQTAFPQFETIFLQAGAEFETLMPSLKLYYDEPLVDHNRV